MAAREAAQHIRLRLRHMAIGVLAVLNRISFEMFHTDFALLLATDPLKAYEALLRYTQGDRRRARLLLHMMLVGVLGRLDELEHALAALEAGDGVFLRRLLEERAGSARLRR